MGACCSCQRVERFDGFYAADEVVEKTIEDEDLYVRRGDHGARVRLQGSSKYISTFIQQGKKGTNQDAMTVWESFTGERDMIFCGVFDGHGPSGHVVARYVRDLLPSKLSSSSSSASKGFNISAASSGGDENAGNFGDGSSHDCDKSENQFYSSWKARILKSFKEMDEELEGDAGIESYCSGTTAVTVIKQREHLIIANLGDSRAVMCTRDDQDLLVAEQLTVDLKPNLPSEAERIRSCQGRVMAMEGEPNVYRIWMPDEDCPGLAMARAFGDFCLKDFGLISTPEVFYRKLTERDEFVVLATDGIWDVLSNNEVVRIVASARKRSTAAKLLVDRAIRAWRYKYPCAKMDDCAVVCLFLKRQRPLLTKSLSEVTELSLNYTELGPVSHNYVSSSRSDDGLDTVLNCQVKEKPTHDVQGAKGEQLADSSGSSSSRETLIRNRRHPTGNLEKVQ
ncbi:probable protein phosphatase 2C 65 [Coffea arabica]|uniref:Probable protein phosphatase 2C 65 n=1 Tax=Coffea arabica TaxID=13443 RepID=A0A6P6SWZ8_COFAR|nr:probable protein phosphatase 2C 65 [Coffea arabica]